MKTIGQLLKDARLSKGISLFDVSKETKIKKSFLDAIEKGAWSKLPDFSVVTGFVKSVAAFVDVNPSTAAAILRRDYPPKPLDVNPKPDLKDRVKFVWSPRLTFLVGALVILLIVGGYLSFQYIKFVSPPPLTVLAPPQDATTKVLKIEVIGKTDPESSVSVNGQPALIEEDGTFKTDLELLIGEQVIEVKAVSRSGKTTVVSRKIKVEE